VTPDLFAALSDAGFGDQIVLASSSFPSATLARPSESASLIRMDGQTVETVLEEIMKFIKVNLFPRFFQSFKKCRVKKKPFSIADFLHLNFIGENNSSMFNARIQGIKNLVD
jgi:L-fucose mutarotase/ribose pyranase (RbsD/FucU family)